MPAKWKLMLGSASVLLLLLLFMFVTRDRSTLQARVSAPSEQLGPSVVVDESLLERGPPETSAGRRALADSDVALAAESAHIEPIADSIGERFSLRVTLRELGGAPLAPGASVHVADESGQGYGTATDADGVALMTDLAPGRWWVRGSAPGRMTESRELHLPSSDAGLELELRLATRPHVRILVHTPDGRPFAKALKDGRTPFSATASRQRPDGWLGDVLEAPDWRDCGFFREQTHTDPEPALFGQIELDCAPPLWVSLHMNEDVLESQLLEPGIDELRFVVDPDTIAARLGEVVMRIVDADGARPLQSVMGQLRSGPRSSQIAFSAGESGLRFGGVMAGRGRLELSALGYDARVLEFTLQPGERKDLGDVTLSRDGSGKLEVHVRGGLGASDLMVTWTTDEELRNRERGAIKPQFSAPVEGEALEIDLARGRWGVWASARREGVELRSPAQPVEMEGGRVAVTLVLEPVTTLVLEPVGRPIDVWVETPEGLLAYNTKLRVDDLPIRVELVPGSYTLRLQEKGREERILHVDLSASGATVRVD